MKFENLSVVYPPCLASGVSECDCIEHNSSRWTCRGRPENMHICCEAHWMHSVFIASGRWWYKFGEEDILKLKLDELIVSG